MKKPNGTREKKAHTHAPNKPPSPPDPPGIDGHEGGDESHGGGKREKQTNYTDKPPHWGPPLEAICAVLLVIITGTYTYYAAQQARANITAANAAASSATTAAETLEMDRPYVSVEVVPISDLKFTPEGRGYLRLGTTVVNYGRNPALNSKIWAQFLSRAKGSPKSETDPTAFCESLNQSAIAGENGGTYFPKVPYKASWVENFSPEADAKVFMPIFIACVAYQSPFSQDWLYTGKTYLILKASHEELGGAMAITTGEDVLQKDLVLAPYMTTISK